MDILIAFKWQITLIIVLLFSFLIFRQEIAQLLKEISWLKTKWFELRRIREEVFAKTKEVKRLSEELNQDKKELREATRVFIESFYLILQTRNIFPIPQQIAQEIEKNLNILAGFAVENENNRKEWIQRIQNLINQNLPK